MIQSVKSRIETLISFINLAFDDKTKEMFRNEIKELLESNPVSQPKAKLYSHPFISDDLLKAALKEFGEKDTPVASKEKEVIKTAKSFFETIRESILDEQAEELALNKARMENSKVVIEVITNMNAMKNRDGDGSRISLEEFRKDISNSNNETKGKE